MHLLHRAIKIHEGSSWEIAGRGRADMSCRWSSARSREARGRIGPGRLAALEMSADAIGFIGLGSMGGAIVAPPVCETLGWILRGHGRG